MTERPILTGIINEEWRSISGYINYQVSNIGRVRNIKSGRVLKLRSMNPMGYTQVALYENNISKTHRVHRLVAREFIDNPDNKSEVDHIDLNKQNNCINNLRWCSKSENQMNTSKRQSCSSIFKGIYFNKAKQKWRAEIKINGQKIHIGYFVDETDAARAYNDKAIELFGAFAN